jgi:hypothetical protein
MDRSPEPAPTTESTKAQGPEHAYDAPGLTATQFLEAVYHDPTVPIGIRIDAANRLEHLRCRDPDYVAREIAKSREPAFTYKIEGITIQ